MASTTRVGTARAPGAPRPPLPEAVSDERASFPVLRLSAGVALSGGDAAGAPPMGCVWAPFGAAEAAADAPPPLPTQTPGDTHAPPRCGACGSFLAPDNGARALRRAERAVLAWVCALCGRENDLVFPSPRDAGNAYDAWTRLVDADTVDYPAEQWAASAAAHRGIIALSGPEEDVGPRTPGKAGIRLMTNGGGGGGRTADIGGSRINIGRMSGGPGRTMIGGGGRGAVVALIDENYRQGEQVDAVVAAVTSVYRKACENEHRFVLLVYGAAVSAAVVPPDGSQAAVEGIIVLDTMSPQQASKMSTEQKLTYFANGASAIRADPASATRRDLFMSKVFRAAICGRAEEYGLQNLTEQNDLETIDIDEGTDHGSVPSEPPPRLPSDAEPRRLDLGIQVALELIYGVADPECSRILSFVSGVPTLEVPEAANPSIAEVVESIEQLSPAPSMTEWSGAVAGGSSSSQGLRPSGGEPERVSTASARSGTDSENQSSWLYSTFSHLLYGPPASTKPASAPVVNEQRDEEDPESVGQAEPLPLPALKKRPKRASSAELRTVFEELGARAGEMRIPLLFLSYGAPDDDGCDVRALYAAAHRSRGGMVYAAPHGFPSCEALCSAAVQLSCWSITPALISIRVSFPLRVDHVIGPASETAAPDTYAVTSTDPSTGFTIVLGTANDFTNRNSGDPSPGSAVLQLVAKSSIRTRVITLRIPITEDRTKFIGTIDAEAAAILLAKVEMVKAGGVDSHSYKLAAALDRSIRRLISHQPPLVSVASLLFGLRRGPLVEAHVGLDEALVLRSIFQRSECTMSSLMLAPRGFYTTTGAGAMAEGPSNSDILGMSNAVVVLDAGAIVFVWVGSDADSKIEQSVVHSAHEVVAARGLAQCIVVHAGDEMDEVLRGYITPKSIQGSSSDSSGLEDVPFMSFSDYVAMLRRNHAPGRLRR